VNYLNLTPDQQAQAKQIMAGAWQEAAPLRQQAQIDRITKAKRQ